MSKYIRRTNRARYTWNQSISEAFWGRVDKNGPIHVIHGQCWLWVAGKLPAGYGKLTDEDRNTVLAHRVSWQLHFGEIPDNLCVLHHCDNPPCVNPSHLFLGTKGDNNQDSAEKGRSCKGEKNCKAKLTEDDVLLIRSMCADGASKSAIAPMFGVSRGIIFRIANRTIWKHI